MKQYLTDVPVALIFFNRPDCLRKSFDAIKESRPSKLFLIQDGPRDNNPSDKELVMKCREIVGNIEWECCVKRIYSSTNLGCGLRVFSGISEAFKDVDRLVIIEDDIVIGRDMLPFCEEILERYKDDERICSISGMNHIGVYEKCPYSYFFASQGGSIWGWATWKRVWDDVEWDLKCADDDYLTNIIPRRFQPMSYGRSLVKELFKKRESTLSGKKQSYWSFNFMFTGRYTQSRLNIVPKVNLIANVGISSNSVHSLDKINYMPRGLRSIYNAPIYDLPKPYFHPKYVVDDFMYSDKIYKIMGRGAFRSQIRRIESKIYRLFPFLG